MRYTTLTVPDYIALGHCHCLLSVCSLPAVCHPAWASNPPVTLATFQLLSRTYNVHTKWTSS